MKSRITARHLDDNQLYETDVELASICPICGVSLTPKTLYAAVIEDEEDEEQNRCFVINYCSKCDECFISRHTHNAFTYVYEHESSAPMRFFKKSFSSDIEKLSPNFVSIYNDSLHAESLGMTSICGMGYRKALEFLVKDFAISNNPNAEDTISKVALAQCIDNYIDSPRLKALAKASAWLGNDETHYVKKHPQYGTSELKTFINAFVTFIDSELAYKNAQNLLSST